MAFSDYRKYTASELQKIFQIKIALQEELFPHFTPSETHYDDAQRDILKMSSRLRVSKFDNEATRGSLLVSRVLWTAGEQYHLGVFFEPLVSVQEQVPLELPHPLNGVYDGAVSLDEIDCVSPIIAVVEVKRSSLSDGLGQCVAEMYATRYVFHQEQVYGIITDGEVWEFLRLAHSVLSVDAQNYYIKNVADIVDRIGYIATMFQSPQTAE